MNKQWTWRAAAIAGLLAGLAACGGGADEGPPPPVGASEPQLFDADSNPTGLVPRRGSGAVVLQLEPNSDQALPLLGDTAGAGTDAVWFDLVRDSALGVKLTDQSLQTVASVALHDLSGAPVWRADASAREAGVWVQRGLPTTPWPRYQLRITPAASATQAAQVIVWFGHADNPAYNAGDLARAGQGGVAICAGCNLQGAQLGGLNLNGANLSSANLRNAWLAAVDPALLELRDGAAFAVFSDASVVRGANLSGANLSGADLTGAIVNGAGQSPASFGGANLSNAVLNGLNLDRADLSGANLSKAQARAASLVGADVSGGILPGLDLRGANLENANFAGANLNAANLSNSRLLGANLSAANLTGTNLSNSRLLGANLDAANLTGTLLLGATWTDGRVCVSPSVGRCD